MKSAIAKILNDSRWIVSNRELLLKQLKTHLESGDLQNPFGEVPT